MGSASTSCNREAYQTIQPINGRVEEIQADGAGGLDIRIQANNDENGKYNFLSNMCMRPRF